MLWDGLVNALCLFGFGVDLLFALLAASSQTKHQVQRRFFLDVVVAEGSAVFKLFSSENQTLLIRRNSLLVLDLGFDIVDRVAGFDIKSDRLARKGFDKDLHDKGICSVRYLLPNALDLSGRRSTGTTEQVAAR